MSDTLQKYNKVALRTFEFGIDTRLRQTPVSAAHPKLKPGEGLRGWVGRRRAESVGKGWGKTSVFDALMHEALWKVLSDWLRSYNCCTVFVTCMELSNIIIVSKCAKVAEKMF